MKAKIAKGEVLNLEGNSIWIRDKYVDRLRLVVTDESIVWKGKYNRGKDFQSYPHIIEPGDIAIARGERRENEFIVERMYANIANIYVTVNEINIGTEEITISFTDTSNRKGIAKVRQDYLIDKAIHAEVAASRQRLRGTIVQIIGLPLRDGTIIASNVLF